MAFLYRIHEIYSNADGSVQYIELIGDHFNQHLVAGNEISSQGVQLSTFEFPADLPGGFPTLGRSVLLATRKFAALDVVTPDYFIPESFLPLSNGTLSIPSPTEDPYTYAALPTDGITALNENGNLVRNGPQNFFNETSFIPANPIVGSGGSDALTGTAEDDYILGLGGSDNMKGAGGDDLIEGGTGNDVLNGGGGRDILSGGGGTDRINAGAGNDAIDFGAGDTINGGADVDILSIQSGGSLNLASAANSDNKLLNIERISTSGPLTMLKLGKADVLAMSSTGKIAIFGDEGDTFNIVGTQSSGDPMAGGHYVKYTIGSAVLIIDSDITVI
jgi:Ca2+-binding RTX toxin-like protein